MPLRVSIPSPTAAEIEQRRLKILEHKRKQEEDRTRRKAEKEASPKKKAKATKGGGPKPSETATQEGPSEPNSNRLTKLLHFSSHPIIEIVRSEEVPAENKTPGPHDHSVTITIPAGVTLEAVTTSRL